MNIEKNISTLKWFSFWWIWTLYPLAIIYYSQISGSFALGISIFSVEMISSALFEVPTGIFSDKIGRKKTVAIGAVCGVYYLTLYTLATNYILLFAGGRYCWTLPRSFSVGITMPLLHDTHSS